MTTPSSSRLRIPNLLQDWPWTARPNPHATDELLAEEMNWLKSLPEVRNNKMLQIIIVKSQISVFASLMFPQLSQAHFRAVLRFMLWGLAIDEPSEQGDVDAVRQRITLAINTIRAPASGFTNSQDQLTEEFWHHIEPLFQPGPRRRFADTLTNGWLDGIIKQASIHTESLSPFSSCTPTVEEFIRLRCDTIGTQVIMHFIEFENPLPEYVAKHAIIKRFADNATMLMLLANDLYSWPKESADGDTHNLIFVLMENLGLSLNGAVTWLETEHTRILRSFLADHEALSSLPPDTFTSSPLCPSQEVDIDTDINARVGAWVEGLGNIVRGNESWSFISPRYFGKEAGKVLERGYFDMLSSSTSSATTVEIVPVSFAPMSAHIPTSSVTGAQIVDESSEPATSTTVLFKPSSSSSSTFVSALTSILPNWLLVLVPFAFTLYCG